MIAKISAVMDDGSVKWFTLQEFVEMPTAERVLMTIGKRNVTYFDANGEEVSKGKAIVFIGKERRKWMDETGQKY